MTTLIYTNQWLSLGCFKGKSQDHRVNKLKAALIKVMNVQDNFSYSDFTPTDASNILVAATALDINIINFLNHFVSVVAHGIKDVTKTDLINLARSSYSLRAYDEFTSFYEIVHSESVQRLTSFQPWQRDTLNEIYSSHGIIEDSPFKILKMSK